VQEELLQDQEVIRAPMEEIQSSMWQLLLVVAEEDLVQVEVEEPLVQEILAALVEEEGILMEVDQEVAQELLVRVTMEEAAQEDIHMVQVAVEAQVVQEDLVMEVLVEQELLIV
jgi:hypothetical protein